jgi:hypothetical protein
MTQGSQSSLLFPTGQFSDWLDALYAGQPRTFGPLSMVPLHAPAAALRDYLLLGEALAQQTLRITEVSQSGTVPELLVVNQGDRPVLLIDGEELVGAKQNRVLNLTVLIAAHRELKIPVSCVEQGRWHYASAGFTDSGRALFARARAHKSRDVSRSMVQGARTADQGVVWRAVAEKLDELQAAAPTRAMSAAYEQRAHSLGEYVDALARADGECGAIFSIGDVPVAVEAFDCADAFRSALPKLIRSYALDALRLNGKDRAGPIDVARAQALLERIGRVRPARYRAIGLGEDLRVEAGTGLAGGALLLSDRLVHVSVFDMMALEDALRGTDNQTRATQ